MIILKTLIWVGLEKKINFGIYKDSQSKLLDRLDFLSINERLNHLQSILQHLYSNPHKKEALSRLLYIITSHLLINLDYVIREVAFSELDVKNKFILNGLRYGYTENLRIKAQLEEVAKIKNITVAKLIATAEKDNADILKDFFGRNEVSKNLFTWTKELEGLGFAKNLTDVLSLRGDLKSIIAIICDYLQIERRLIFGTI